MVPLPTPDGPASDLTTTSAGRGSRRCGRSWGGRAGPRAGCGRAPEPAALADVELFHDAARLHLADARERFEHAHDLELRERVVARALVEQVFETQRALLELRLHLRALTARFGGLLECGLTLLGGERRGSGIRLPPGRRRRPVYAEVPV